MAPGDKRIIYNVETTEGEDGLLRDKFGSVYGVADGPLSRDEKVRLGVGFLSLSESHPLTLAARFHDFAYSSLLYMRSHPRSEADREFLRQALELAGGDRLLRAQAFAMYAAVRAVGWYWWDVADTRWN